MPIRYDRFQIDSHEVVGQVLRVDGFLSRTGVQVYDQGDGTQQREQRDADEVFSDDAMRSFHGVSVTVGHPRNVMVTDSNWKKFHKGHVGSDVRRAEDGTHTRASLYIIDGPTKKRILDSELTELSCGYYADLDFTPGVNEKGEHYDARQINIRGNHVALIRDNEARGGRGCRMRLDSQGDAHFADDEEDDDGRGDSGRPASTPDTGRKRHMPKITIRADGYDHIVEAEDDKLVVALEKERTTARAELDSEKAARTKAEADLEAERARADAAEEAKAKAEEDLEKATNVDAMNAAIEARAELRDNARLVSGKKDLDVTGSDAEIMRRALDARGTKIDENESADYIRARFDFALEDARKAAKKNDPLSRAREAASGHHDGGGNHEDTREPINVTGTLTERLATRKEAN